MRSLTNTTARSIKTTGAGNSARVPQKNQNYGLQDSPLLWHPEAVNSLDIYPVPDPGLFAAPSNIRLWEGAVVKGGVKVVHVGG